MTNVCLLSGNDWEPVIKEEEQKLLATLLESGRIIYFPKLNFHLLDEEKKLMELDTEDMRSKNVSYNPLTHRLKGITCAPHTENTLKKLSERFYLHAYSLVGALFPFYQKNLLTDLTSFRPIEIEGRSADSYKKDDTRLHVDAFPSRPNRGKRLLRVFSNINFESKDRVWRVGEPFERVAQRFFPKIRKPLIGSAMLRRTLGITKNISSRYDNYMLQLHDHMKADREYQTQVPYEEVRLSAGSTWIVMTDCVSHAVLSGQHMMEQTFYLPMQYTVRPEISPLHILQKLAGRELV